MLWAFQKHTDQLQEAKVANVFITKEIPSYEFMPYAFGSNLIETVILKGKIQSELTHKIVILKNRVLTPL